MAGTSERPARANGRAKVQGVIPDAPGSALDEKAAGASLGWLEKATGSDGLKARIQSGERPMVFDLPVSGRKISWPKSLGGYAMKIEADDRKWIVSLNYPSGGGVWQMINMVKSGGTTKPWKQALKEAGAT